MVRISKSPAILLLVIYSSHSSCASKLSRLFPISQDVPLIRNIKWAIPFDVTWAWTQEEWRSEVGDDTTPEHGKQHDAP